MEKCALFADLSDKELEKLADRMDEDHFPAKTQILKEGEEAWASSSSSSTAPPR